MKIFVLLSRAPYPLEKGDKLRAYHQVKYLHGKHEVFLCCLTEHNLDEKATEELQQICSELQILKLSKWRIWFNMLLATLGSQPFQVRYFYQAPVHRRVKALLKSFQPDHIYCQLARAAEYVKKERTVTKTIDYQDAFSANMLSRSRIAPWYMRPILRQEYRRMLTYENLLFEYFEGKTIISEQDRNLIFHDKRAEIDVVPNGVDVHYFKPGERKPTVDLVFTGNMNYPPNVDCAQFLAQEVLPMVWKQRPETTLMISGANPSAKVQALRSDKVEITGWVEDIRDAYNAARIFVAPMRLGTGMQNKLLEAMSLGIPCITSPQVNNALGAEPGKHLLLASDASQCAHQILSLLQDEEQIRSLARAGRDFIESNFSWEKSGEKLESVFNTAR